MLRHSSPWQATGHLGEGWVTRSDQAELSPPNADATVDELIAYLNSNAPRLVTLKLTRNRVSMLSINFSTPDRVKIRMRKECLTAPASIWESLKDYIIGRDRDKWKTVASFARNVCNDARLGEKPRLEKLVAVGKVHDLAAICADVNRAFFNGEVACRIGWGRRRPQKRGRRKSRHIRLGSWFAETGIIRVHPILDSHAAPAEFVRYIVFHEMLHAVIKPVVSRDGRRFVHSAEFNARERTFPNYRRMRKLAFEFAENLP